MRFQSHALTASEVAAEGFATFNSVPNKANHVMVELPEGNATLTCRTPDGKRITFAFCQRPDQQSGHQCVDIVLHDSGKTVRNGSTDIPLFSAMLRNGATGGVVCHGEGTHLSVSIPK